MQVPLGGRENEGTWDGWLEREQGKKRGREKMNFWVCWGSGGNGDLRDREV
jgi:hypothetical protein